MKLITHLFENNIKMSQVNVLVHIVPLGAATVEIHTINMPAIKTKYVSTYMVTVANNAEQK